MNGSDPRRPAELECTRGTPAETAGVPEIAGAVRLYEAHQEWPGGVKSALAAHLLSGLLPPPRRCLFLGAASGVNDALPFARTAGPGIRVVGSDVETAHVDRLRERAEREGLRNVEARVIDLREELGALGTFDLVTLLFVVHRLERWHAVIDPLAGPQFDQFQTMIRAVMAGMGLALVPRCLVQDEITAGLVREPLADALLRGGYLSDKGYWFCFPEGRTPLHALQCFRQWLLACAAPADAHPMAAAAPGTAADALPGS